MIDPDVQCDFTDLPFADNYFSLVVFDPPHIPNLTEASWMRRMEKVKQHWKERVKICDNDCEHCEWVTCPKMEQP